MREKTLKKETITGNENTAFVLDTACLLDICLHLTPLG